MTFQWALVAGFLYLEIAIIFLLLLPFISPAFWQKVFRSRIAAFFSARAGIYFNVVLLGLVITFLSAIYDVNRFSKIAEKDTITRNVNADNLAHMRLFRSQRNLYISGFALFLILVLKRIVMLIAAQAQLMAAHEASLRQAKSASAAAQQLMDEKEKAKEEKRKDGDAELQEELEELRKKLQLKNECLREVEDEKERLQRDYETLKSQANQNNKAYDGLMDEHAALQRRLAAMEGNDGTKKED